jgi:hypothetical protein
LIALPSTLPMGWVNSVPYFQVGSLRRHWWDCFCFSCRFH